MFMVGQLKVKFLVSRVSKRVLAVICDHVSLTWAIVYLSTLGLRTTKIHIPIMSSLPTVAKPTSAYSYTITIRQGHMYSWKSEHEMERKQCRGNISSPGGGFHECVLLCAVLITCGVVAGAEIGIGVGTGLMKRHFEYAGGG